MDEIMDDDTSAPFGNHLINFYSAPKAGLHKTQASYDMAQGVTYGLKGLNPMVSNNILPPKVQHMNNIRFQYDQLRELRQP